MKKKYQKDSLLTIKQAANYLSISVNTLYWIRYVDKTKPRIAFVKMGKSVRYKVKDLDKYLESCLVK